VILALAIQLALHDLLWMDKNKNALSIEEQNFRKWIKGVLQK
jgi:hypothetical protein